MSKKRKKHGKSILHKEEYADRCYLCMTLNDNYAVKSGMETHHVMFGQGRRDKSEADGLTVRLCREHHRAVHRDNGLRRILCAIAQRAWEDAHRVQYGSAVRQRWTERYGRNYQEEW
ncbi:MAG: hypothetical protein Q4A32_00900 [Lachnospiraceae bacterium]|nr:hypothetical protein [Lachnospiraceae bacterium]